MEKKEIRTIITQSVDRVETGTLQFGEDYPGTFVRGDDAFKYATSISHLLEQLDVIDDKGEVIILGNKEWLVEQGISPIALLQLKTLMDLFLDSNVSNKE